MQKRVITLLMIIVGASLGISFLPSAWQAIGQQSNGWLNNTFTNSLLGALIFFFIIFAVGQTYLSYYQTSRTKTK